MLTVYGGSHPVERVTRARMVCDSNHAQVHAGNAYHVSIELTGLSGGASSVVTLDIPANAFVHFQSFSGMLDKLFSLELIEGDTPTTGTLIPAHQRNRINGSASVLTVHNAIVTANTTVLEHKHLVGGDSVIQGVGGGGDEWVFAQSKSYSVKITNEGAQPATAGFIGLEWYEEEGA